MKRHLLRNKQHRIIAQLLLCSTVITLTSACSCTKCCMQKDQTCQQGINLIEPDSIARLTLGDTAVSIMMQAKTVSLYTLNPLTRPGDNDFTIGNYKVEKKECDVPLDFFPILAFLLSDSNNYDRGENVQSIRFIPSQAISITAETDSISMLFSPVSMEIGIVRKGIIQNIFRYNNQRLFLLFFKKLLNNDIYDKMLNNYQQ